MARRFRPLRILRRLATVVVLLLGTGYLLMLLARLARHSVLLGGAVSCGLLLVIYWSVKIGALL